MSIEATRACPGGVSTLVSRIVVGLHATTGLVPVGPCLVEGCNRELRSATLDSIIVQPGRARLAHNRHPASPYLRLGGGFLGLKVFWKLNADTPPGQARVASIRKLTCTPGVQRKTYGQ